MIGTCKVEGCENKVAAKRCCAKHYRKLQLYGNVHAGITYLVQQDKCSVDGCENKYFGLGYCQKHYHNFKNHGNPIAPSRVKKGRTLDGGYWRARCPGHPRAHGDGQYVFEHVLIMENHLGRYIDAETEVVHHKGTMYPLDSIENKSDNRLGNLEVMTKKEHRILHNKARKIL